MSKHLLIVDDKPQVGKSLARNFVREGFAVTCAATAEEALAIVRGQPVAAVLLDVQLGESDGLAVLRELKSVQPALPVIMITGFGTIARAVEAIKLGAQDFLEKPLSFPKVLLAVQNALQVTSLRAENRELRASVAEWQDLAGEAGRLVTVHPPLLALLERARKLAASDIPVLLAGESGTGKELLARYIHRHSARASRPLVQINCAAIPPTLLDGELFGHVKGAFSGAIAASQGVFEKAHTGTLHLDEIGDMSLETQAKILRVLENGIVKRIGSQDTVAVDVRYVVSSNKDLAQLVSRQLFRQDLLFRLNAAALTIPPLRDRPEDIPLLAEHFLRQFALASSQGPSRLAPAVLEVLQSYPWPGNVRELRNCMQYASTLCAGPCIGLDALPARILEDEQTPPLAPGDGEAGERERLLAALAEAHYNKKKAAESLGLSRRTLYNKLEKHGIPLA